PTISANQSPESPISPHIFSLISAYDKSCWSYGLSRALVSPISAEADEQFSQALSYLLREDRHHINIGSTTFVFWADSGGMTRHLFETPSVETVRDYLNGAIAQLAQTTAIPTTFSIGAQAYFDLSKLLYTTTRYGRPQKT
ncbi:MAG: type I-C CRISPR-associated protein Cas8c/Csd1, partial [Coleofasciculus sp.]